jgi:hypothetical protein
MLVVTNNERIEKKIRDLKAQLLEAKKVDTFSNGLPVDVHHKFSVSNMPFPRKSSYGKTKQADSCLSFKPTW